MNKLQKLAVVTKASWETIFTKNLESTIEGGAIMKNLYSMSDLAYICISTTGKAISQVPLVVSEKKGNSRVPVSPEDEYQRVINRPNPYLDKYSFVEAIVSTLLLDGNVYVVPFPPSAPQPVSLWVVRRRNMEPVLTKNGHIGAWKYRWGENESESVPLKFQEVMPIFFWNPDDPFYGMDKGMPPAKAGEIALTSDYKAARYNQMFFTEGAVPAGVLQTEKTLRDGTYNRIKEQFENRHQGYQKGHRVAILEQGLTYTPIGISHKDMDFDSLRKYNRQTVLQLYGMKESIISITGDVNRATAREQRKEWWEGTNLPIMKLISSAFQYGLMADTGKEISFDTSLVEALHETFKDKVDSAVALFKMGFTASELNERLDLGFGEKPWRKFWYLPINMVRVEQDGSTALDGNNNNNLAYVDSRLLEEGIDILGEGTKDLIISLGTTDDNRHTALERVAFPLEKQFELKTKKLFFDMRKKTLGLLFKERRDIQEVEEELFAKERSDLIRYSVPLHHSSLELGIETLKEEIGLDINFNLESDPLSIEYLARKRNQIVGIVNTVKQGIMEEIRRGVDRGESVEQIADRIRNVYNLASNRSMRIARTEVFGSINYGRWMAIQRSGFKEEIWYTAADEKVRLSHKPMHGVKKKIGENWVMPDGSTLRFPGDFRGPARQVINCRCVAFVVKQQ